MTSLNHSSSFLCSWSGGKDCYLAFLKAYRAGAEPRALFNMLNENGEFSRSHGIPKNILKQQAKCVNLPIWFGSATWQDYETAYIEKLQKLKMVYEPSNMVFGDIDIESHKAWEEKVSEAAGLEAELPLWQQNREALVYEMVDLGIKAMIVSCRKELAPQLLGKIIDKDMIKMFHKLEIDACGENGEYHTLVVDGPLHREPLAIKTGEILSFEHYAFIELFSAT